MIISFLNQKGGVGKSTLARAIAVEFIKNKWEVIVADMDSSQRTTSNWAEVRKQQNIEPPVETGVYREAKTALKMEAACNVLIIDGAAYADKSTKTVAEKSDLIVIPTGITADDLHASLALGQELALAGIEKESIYFVVIKVPDNGDKEAMATRKSIQKWGFNVAQGWIPFKTGYGKAMDSGRTLVETRHKSLNDKSGKIIQNIVDYALLINQSRKEAV